MLKNKYIYFLILPAIVYIFIFSYLPMYGMLLAFKEMNFGQAILAMPWAGRDGLDHFREIFKNPQVWHVLRNTLLISLGRIIFEFPAPILLALCLNEVRMMKLKRTLQTVFTFPHFLSWVILGGILNSFLNSDGAFNNLVKALGGQAIPFQTNGALFIPMLFLTSIWKEFGWGAIIYLAAISSINPEIYEAATIDGASRIQQIRHITWPSIAGMVSIMLVLSCGGVLDGGFDQILNTYNATVYPVADVLSTYIFRMTLQTPNLSFDFSTAVGLLQSVVNLAVLFLVNRFVIALGQEGMF
jgi:putative aldouronate transport system permease protein